MSQTCTTEAEACGCGTESCGGKASCPARCPGCGQSNCADPYECGAKMWGGSFMQAMKETQVDILKVKIQKAWGPMMDKAADGVLEAMGTYWQSMLAQARAKEGVKDMLRELWQDGKKK